MRSAMVPFGWIIGCPLLGFLSDRLGRRKPVIVAGAVVLFLCLAWILYGPADVPPPYVLALVAGVASGAAMLPYTGHQGSEPADPERHRDRRRQLHQLHLQRAARPGLRRALDVGQRRCGGHDARALSDGLRADALRRRAGDRAHSHSQGNGTCSRAAGSIACARPHDSTNRNGEMRTTAGALPEPPPVPTAVAHPCEGLRSRAIDAAAKGLIVPILSA